MSIGNAITQQQGASQKPPTLTEQLTREREFLTSRIAEIDIALEKLAANPDLEIVVKAMTGVCC